MDVKKGYNAGLDLLRAFMSFQVILCHFWDGAGTGWKIWLDFFRGYAVPVFMLMSFFLTEKTLISCDGKKIKKRLKRLLIPFLFWPFVYWFVFNIVNLWKSEYELGCSITDLLWQLFMGHTFNAAMWYQLDLILLTLFFVGILCFFKRYYMHIFYICMMAAWFFQYSGWNKQLFGGLRFEMTYPLGRLAEMLPYAVCGFAMARLRGHKDLGHTLVPGGGIIASILFIMLVRYYPVFVEIDGFGYSGFRRFFVAIALVALFYLLPFHKLPGAVLRLLYKSTRFTMGIYCMHLLVGQLLRVMFMELNIAVSPLKQCVLIYILCYIISYGLSKIPVAFVQKLVE